MFKDPEPDKKVSSSINRKFRWLKTLIKEDINILGLALFLGICMSVLGLSTAIFSQRLLDDILPSGDMMRLMVGLGLLLVLLFIRSSSGRYSCTGSPGILIPGPWIYFLGD